MTTVETGPGTIGSSTDGAAAPGEVVSTDDLAAGDAAVPDAAVGDGTILDEAWELSRSVALRPEPFGALAYHFGNRRLIFLKRPELVEVVRGLGAAPDVRTALTLAGVPAARWAAYARALRGLAAADVIRQRDPDRDPPGDPK